MVYPSSHFIKGAIWVGRDRMVVGFTTNCAISAYHHKSCEFEHSSFWGVLDTPLCFEDSQ